ncbi:hypothetical protein BJV78DRAFT_1356773 [Lactifluus subvellereus]|nr:hypothetical protein BJV78DRAFT_1356773 [Lactifluus subvellereus]
MSLKDFPGTGTGTVEEAAPSPTPVMRYVDEDGGDSEEDSDHMGAGTTGKDGKILRLRYMDSGLGNAYTLPARTWACGTSLRRGTNKRKCNVLAERQCVAHAHPLLLPVAESERLSCVQRADKGLEYMHRLANTRARAMVMRLPGAGDGALDNGPERETKRADSFAFGGPEYNATLVRAGFGIRGEDDGAEEKNTALELIRHTKLGSRQHNWGTQEPSHGILGRSAKDLKRNLELDELTVASWLAMRNGKVLSWGEGPRYSLESVGLDGVISRPATCPSRLRAPE